MKSSEIASDSDVWRGFDVAQIAELYGPLRRFAAVVGPLDVEPDDLLQEALVRMVRTRSADQIENIGAYMRRIIVNLASNHRRRLGRQRKAWRRWAEPGQLAEDTYPSDVTDLMRLEPRRRAVLFLHDVEGYSFDELAELLGIKSGTARALASRARKELRTVMEREVGE